MMKLSKKFFIGLIMSVVIVIASAISWDCHGPLATNTTLFILGVLSAIICGILILFTTDWV